MPLCAALRWWREARDRRRSLRHQMRAARESVVVRVEDARWVVVQKDGSVRFVADALYARPYDLVVPVDGVAPDVCADLTARLKTAITEIRV
jgi:hypothetical protein